MDAEPLVAACELAFAVAREGEKAVPPIEPPPAMRNYLYVPQLPRRAITVAERAIDEDPDFRSRVAAAATEQSVGRDGYLWLTRPAGWNSDSSQPTSVVEAPRAEAPAPEEAPEVAAAPAPTPPPPTPPAATSPAPTPPAPTPTAARAAATPPAPAPPAPSRPLPSRAAATPPPPPRPRPVNAPPLPTPVVPPTTVASASPATPPAVVPSPTPPANKPTPGPAATGSIQDELADLRGLVDQLSEERENMSATAPDTPESDEPVATAAPATPTPAIPAVPTPAVQAPAGFVAQAPVPDSGPELAAAQDRITDLESQLALANDGIANANSDAKAAMAQAAALAARESSDAEARTKLEDDLSALQLEADAAKTDASSAANARDEAQAIVASLTGERDEAQAAVISLTGERDDSANELQGLRHEYSVAAGALVERDHLQETLSSVQGERDELASRVEVAEQARIDLERQLSQVSAQWQALQIELESARSSLVDTRGAFRSSMQTMDEELTKTETILSGSAPAVPDLGAVEIGTALPAAAVVPEELVDPALVAETAVVDPSIDYAPAERLAPSPFAPAVTEHIEIPDVVVPDVEVPDLSVPDVEVPDVEVPDVEVPNSDIQSGDLATMLDSYGLGADAPVADLSAPIETSIDIPTDAVPDFSADQFVDIPNAPEELAPVDTEFETTRTQISFPADIGHDPLAQIRLVVATDDVVVLVDGDAVAEMGWPETPVSARREALVKYLGDLAADTGAAQDTVFSGSLSDGEDLPVSRAVRVRITAPGVRPADALAELVTSYPQEWPVAVVSDDAELMVYADNNGATVLSNGQLLDLLFDRWEASQAD